MKKLFIVILGAFAMGALVIGGMSGPEQSAVQTQAATVENVAYLTEHFTWNTGRTSIIVTLHEPYTICTGLAPEFVGLPNLHVNVPAFGPTGLPTSAVGGMSSDNNFRNMPNIIKVTMPDTVTCIMYSAFMNASIATMPDFPTGITIFQGFEGNPFITNDFVLPSQFTQIGYHAFRNSGLTSFNIPSTVTRIRNAAFMDNQLTSISIPDTVTNIGSSAFTNNQLESIRIPGGATIGAQAFDNNPFREIIFGHGITNFLGLTFEDLGTLERIVIPSTLTANLPASVRTATIWGMIMTVEDAISMGGEIVTEGDYEYIELWGQRGRLTGGEGPFAGNPNLTIYTAHRSRPANWAEDFNVNGSGGFVPVAWGYATVDVDTVGQGVISVANELPMHGMESGDTRTLKAEPSEGWQFVRWDINS